jgi:protein involved in polysaccharide export with SLBB domain
MTIRPAALAALLWLCTAARPAAAQQMDLSTGPKVSRPELEQLLRSLDQASEARDSNPEARARTRGQANAVRARLAQGDFHAGDRVLLRVESGEAPADRSVAPAERPIEQQLSDTFSVAPDRTILLPAIGTISLAGVLHAELEAHLTRELGKFIRDPVVHARPLIRIGIVGAVARPGFYAIPADVVLSDALMVAGGPTPDAKVASLRIERAGERLWEGDVLRQAITDGRTLDEMNLRAGDQFVVPSQSRTTGYEALRTVGILLSIPVTIYTLTKIF